MSQTKSYYNLLISTYGLVYRNGISNSHVDTGLLTSPTSLVRSGYFVYSSASLGSRGSSGYYWESTVSSATLSRDLYFFSTTLSPQFTGHKGYGFTLRCVGS